MVKRRPHYSLDEAIEQVRILGLNAFTMTAINGGHHMGISGAELVKAVCGIKKSMFVKSMTTHQNNQIWQDVYHLPLESGSVAYVKITLFPGTRVIIQFKERDDG